MAASSLGRRGVVGVPSWPLLSLALGREVGPAGPRGAPAKDRVGGPEPAAPGQRGLEAGPYFQRRPCPGAGPQEALPAAPDVGLRDSVSRARPEANPHRIRSQSEPRAAAPGLEATAHSLEFPERHGLGAGAGPRPPRPAAPRSTPGRGAAMATGAGRPASLAPRHPPVPARPPHREAPDPSRRRRPAGRGLSGRTPRRRPRRGQDGGPRGRGAEGSGGEGRKRGRLPSRRPLSRLRRGEEMAPEAIIELPVCLA